MCRGQTYKHVWWQSECCQKGGGCSFNTEQAAQCDCISQVLGGNCSRSSSLDTLVRKGELQWWIDDTCWQRFPQVLSLCHVHLLSGWGRGRIRQVWMEPFKLVIVNAQVLYLWIGCIRQVWMELLKLVIVNAQVLCLWDSLVSLFFWLVHNTVTR